MEHITNCKECCNFEVCRCWETESNLLKYHSPVDCEILKRTRKLTEQDTQASTCKIGDIVYIIVENSCENNEGRDKNGKRCIYYFPSSEGHCRIPTYTCPYHYMIEKSKVTEQNLSYITSIWNKSAFHSRHAAATRIRELDPNAFVGFDLC